MKEKKSQVITCRTTEAVKNRLTEEAEARGWTLSQLAEKILSTYATEEKTESKQINFISSTIKKVNIN